MKPINFLSAKRPTTNLYCQFRFNLKRANLSEVHLETFESSGSGIHSITLYVNCACSTRSSLDILAFAFDIFMLSYVLVVKFLTKLYVIYDYLA